jgi:hypothetical protein
MTTNESTTFVLRDCCILCFTPHYYLLYGVDYTLPTNSAPAPREVFIFITLLVPAGTLPGTVSHGRSVLHTDRRRVPFRSFNLCGREEDI